MEKVKLSSICTIQSGGTPSRSKSEYWKNGTIPWVKIGDFTDRYISHTSEMITPEGLENSSTKMFPKGTILYTIFATLGEIAILNIDACTNQAIAGLFLHDENIDKEYLVYYLKSKKKYVNEIGRGVAQNNINMSMLRDFEVPLLPLAEQKKISDILLKTESVIADRKQQLAELDTLIKARFVEMFGDPVANLMKWPVKKLGELSVQINSGNTPKGGREVYVDEGITFFRSQNVWKDRLEMEDIAYIDEATHKSMSRSSLKHGDILMTKTGRINTENSSLGRAALYMGEDDAANVNGHVYFIRLKPGVNNQFVLKILVSNEYRDLIRKVCVGGIDKRQLNKDHIEDFPIICPPDELVEAYVAFAEQVDKLKVVVQEQIDKLQMLFDSLMQEYFG